MSRADIAFARIDGARIEVQSSARCSGLAQLNRRTRRRVDLVLVMHLDDFDIVGRAERTRRAFDQLEQNIDADAHIRRVDDRDRRGVLRENSLMFGVEAGRADHGGDAMAGACGDMRHRSRRPCEIDQDVCCAHRGFHIGLHERAGHATEALGGIMPDERVAGHIEGARDLEIACRQRRLNQRLPHAPACAGDA